MPVTWGILGEVAENISDVIFFSSQITHKFKEIKDIGYFGSYRGTLYVSYRLFERRTCVDARRRASTNVDVSRGTSTDVDEILLAN